jgi:hypothetical protein
MGMTLDAPLSDQEIDRIALDGFLTTGPDESIS